LAFHFKNPMLGVFRVPVADNHGSATHRDIVELRLGNIVQHLIEIDNVAVMALFHVHFVETAKTDNAVADMILGKYLLAVHAVGIINTPCHKLLLEIVEGLLLAVLQCGSINIYLIGAISYGAYIV